MKKTTPLLGILMTRINSMRKRSGSFKFIKISIHSEHLNYFKQNILCSLWQIEINWHLTNFIYNFCNILSAVLNSSKKAAIGFLSTSLHSALKCVKLIGLSKAWWIYVGQSFLIYAMFSNISCMMPDKNQKVVWVVQLT